MSPSLPASLSRSSRVSEIGPLHGLRVLLVEDDLDVREATLALLEDEGAHVIAMDAAEPALAALAEPGAGFDLVFSDVVLGGDQSGFDVAAAALAQHPRLPVVLATGYTGRAGRIPPALAKTVPVLLKPFRRAELLAAVAAVCVSRRAVA